MKLRPFAALAPLAALLVGCASVQYGDKLVEQDLRKLSPVTGKVSLYVCRENAVFLGAGARATVHVNGKAIGTLKPNNFAHTLLPPGRHEIYLDRGPLNTNSGALTLDGKGGDVVLVWAGMTGGGFGTLTVDWFATKNEAEQCVRNAEYAVQATQ